MVSKISLTGPADVDAEVEAAPERAHREPLAAGQAKAARHRRRSTKPGNSIPLDER